MASAARRLVRSLAFGAVFLAAGPALAVETGAPPQLPPPPPPPPGSPGAGAAPASPSKGGTKTPDTSSTAPAASQGAGGGGGAPHRVMTGSSSPSSSSSSSSGVSESSGDSGGSSGGGLDTRWALAGMLGVATDCMNFGLGVRGGKTLDNHLYLGGSALYHFAGCGYGGYYAPGYSVSASVFYLGPEAGYDFDLSAVVLRVYGGLGPAFFNASVSAPGVPTQSSSDTRFVVWPGVSVIWSIPSSQWFIGGDLRFVSVPNGPSVGFFFTGGIHFGE